MTKFQFLATFDRLCGTQYYPPEEDNCKDVEEIMLSSIYVYHNGIIAKGMDAINYGWQN